METVVLFLLEVNPETERLTKLNEEIKINETFGFFLHCRQHFHFIIKKR